MPFSDTGSSSDAEGDGGAPPGGGGGEAARSMPATLSDLLVRARQRQEQLEGAIVIAGAHVPPAMCHCRGRPVSKFQLLLTLQSSSGTRARANTKILPSAPTRALCHLLQSGYEMRWVEKGALCSLVSWPASSACRCNALYRGASCRASHRASKP